MYQRSGRVNEYYNTTRNLEKNKPDEFESKYEDQISSILDNIMNRPKFSYTSEDMVNDDLYKMYRDQYMRQGNLAMRDTMGNAAALTGGYGNTYASAAGQQAYDNYVSMLNDKALEFYDRAYQRYNDEGQNLYNQMNVVRTISDIEIRSAIIIMTSIIITADITRNTDMTMASIRTAWQQTNGRRNLHSRSSRQHRSRRTGKLRWR